VGAGHPKKSRGLLREGERLKFAFIDAEKAAASPVSKLCKVFGVSRSGFYAWRDRPPSQRAIDDAQLAVLARAIHAGSRRTYGSPRVHAELRIAHDRKVSRKRVARIMRQEGLVARVRKRYRSTSIGEHEQPIAPNLLDRRFDAPAPNERWVGDVTLLRIGSSAPLWLASILDLHSRFVVGWAVSAVNDTQLAIRALEMALSRRRPAGELLHHTDQGSPYASDAYQRLLTKHGMTCSMSRRGNCYDNAAMESWFSTLKSELGERFESYADAKEKLFDFIEVFYNHQRRHSSLGYVSPAEFERTVRSEKLAA